MLDYVNQLSSRYRTRGILIDTNPLLLYVVGLLGRRQIASFKRTYTYELEGFDLLARVVSHFEAVVTTPHVLAETSNFVGQLPGAKAQQGRAALGELVPYVREAHRVTARQASAVPAIRPRRHRHRRDRRRDVSRAHGRLAAVSIPDRTRSGRHQLQQSAGSKLVGRF